MSGFRRRGTTCLRRGSTGAGSIASSWIQTGGCLGPNPGGDTGSFLLRFRSQHTAADAVLQRDLRRASDTSVLSVSVPPWLHAQLAGKLPDLRGALQACAKPPTAAFFNKHTRSQGPFLHRRYPVHRYHDPVRLPLEPMPYGTVEAATLAQHGPPPLARSSVLTCGAHYPGGPVQVRLSAASPDRAAFPELRAGRRPQLPFQGLLRLHSHYGPSSCSPARGGPRPPQGRLRRRASIQPIAQLSRLSATGLTDHCPGGTLHPQGDRALRGAPEFHRPSRRKHDGASRGTRLGAKGPTSYLA